MQRQENNNLFLGRASFISFILVIILFLSGCVKIPPGSANANTTNVTAIDTDGDGIQDLADNCPNVPNTDQKDMDGDARGDACDSDRDGDNVTNTADNCPNHPNPEQYDTEQDGRGDACDINLFTIVGIFDPINEQSPVPPDLSTTSETGYYLIQIKNDSTQAEFQSLAAQGKILDIIPKDGIIFKTKMNKSRISSYTVVRYVEILQPAYRLSPEFLELHKQGKLRNLGSANRSINRTDLRITVFENIDGVESELRKRGTTLRLNNETLELYNATGTDVIEIAYLPDIAFIETKPVYRLLNDVATGIMQITSTPGTPDSIRIKGLGGTNQIVAVADSGLDTGVLATLHPDINGRVDATFALGKPVASIWTDFNGHGTHVVGSIIGDGSSSGGTIQGSAPAAHIVFQALESNGPLQTQVLGGIPVDLKTLFQQAYSVNNQVRIHTNSWGGRVNAYLPASQQIDEFVWNNKDMLILFAAGNDGRNGAGTISQHANAKNALIVGASESNQPLSVVPVRTGFAILHVPSGLWLTFITPPQPIDIKADNINDRAEFSSMGPTPKGRIKPDIVAPGSWILSTRSSACVGTDFGFPDKADINFDTVVDHRDCVGNGLPGAPANGFSGYTITLANPAFSTTAGNPLLPLGVIPSNPILPGAAALGANYMYVSGTSMATPLVAGGAALVREYYQTYKNVSNPSAALMKATIINGAEDMPGTITPVTSTPSVPNNAEGFGRVNIMNSLFPGNASSRVFFAEATLNKEKDYRNYTVRTNQMYPLVVTLAWTDYPASVKSGGILMNDLDLKVYGPDGTKYLGNSMTAGISTKNPADNTKDSNNNVEKIIIPSPKDGLYSIIVTAYDLENIGFLWWNRRAQDFAVVIAQTVGADSANQTGNYKYNFTNEDVYLNATGAERNETVRVQVVKYNGPAYWVNGIDLTGLDVSGASGIRFSADENGKFNGTLLWPGASNWIYYGGGEGKYNIVIDRSRKNFFEIKQDFVDYYERSGFRVQAVTSADKDKNVKKTFTSDDAWVYAFGGGFENNTNMSIYLLPYRHTGFSDFYLKGNVTTDGNGIFAPKRLISSPTNEIYKYGGYILNLFSIQVDTKPEKPTAANPNLGLFDAARDSKDHAMIEEIEEAVTTGAAPLAKGMSSYAVIELQAFLNSQSFKTNVTGNFSTETETALNAYLKSRDLTPDGNVDVNDLGMMADDAKRSFRIHAIAATNKNLATKKVYVPSETIFSKGIGFVPNKTIDLYAIKHDGTLDNGVNLAAQAIKEKTRIKTNRDGVYLGEKVWENITSRDAGFYDLVADVDLDGSLNKSVDTIDKVNLYALEEEVAKGPVGLNASGDVALELEIFLQIYWSPRMTLNSNIDSGEAAAIASYQTSRNLAATGKVDALTLAQMKKEVAYSFRIQAIESSDENARIKSEFVPYEEPKPEVSQPICTDEDAKANSLGSVGGTGVIGGVRVATVARESKPSIYALGAGFLPGKQSKIYIVNESNNWVNGMKLNDESGGAEPVVVDSEGRILNKAIWENITRENAGLYDVIVDVDGDGYFNDSVGSRDAADQLIKWGVSIPRVDSSGSDKLEKNLFIGDDEAVYAHGVGFVPNRKMDIYVVRNNNSWADGTELKDVSENIERNIEANDKGEFFISVWNKLKSGKYDIVIDIDRNGIYNKSTDVIDLAKSIGFEVRANWTLMVYMAAEKNLEQDALKDLNEMESVGSSGKSVIVAQVDLPKQRPATTTTWQLLNSSPTRLYVEKDNDQNLVNSTIMMVLPETSMGNARTLLDFVDWSARCYPAESYVLVLWGDGDGWKTNPSIPTGLLTDTDPANDAMEMTELKQAADGLPAILNNSKVDILAFDGPLMASVEVALQIKNGAEIMVASQGIKPIKGKEPPTKKNSTVDWNYEDVIKRLNKNPKQSARNYSKELVYHARAAGIDTLSAISLEGIDGLVTEINGLADVKDLRGDIQPESAPASCSPIVFPERTGLFDYEYSGNYIDNVQTAVLDSRMKAQTFGGIEGVGIESDKYAYDLDGTPEEGILKPLRWTDEDPVWGDMDYVDIYHFADLIQKDGRIRLEYKNHAQPIMNLLVKNGPLVIEEYHSASFPNAHGLSIYYPYQQVRHSKNDPIHEYSYDNPNNLSATIYHQTPNLLFPTNQGAIWWKNDNDIRLGRLLKRYYNPETDAIILDPPTITKIKKIIVPNCNQISIEVPFSGTGTSDSDFEGFAPFGRKLQAEYYWNFGDGSGCSEVWNDKPTVGDNNGYPEPHEVKINTCDNRFDGLAKHTYRRCGCFVVNLETRDDDQNKDNDWAYVIINQTIDPTITIFSDPWTRRRDRDPPPIPPPIERSGRTVTPRCGDGYLSAGEECDLADNPKYNKWSGAKAYQCSDQTKSCVNCKCVSVTVGQVSQPRNTSITPPITPVTPQIPVCGNGILEGTERCETNSTDLCGSGTYCAYNCQCVPYVESETHTRCDIERRACVSVEGAGENECNTDPDCSVPQLNCPAYCRSQGYNESLGGNYTSAAQCQQAAGGSNPSSCSISCIYSKFHTETNRIGDATCCCKATYVQPCERGGEGGGCFCPTPELVCPTHRPTS